MTSWCETVPSRDSDCDTSVAVTSPDFEANPGLAKLFLENLDVAPLQIESCRVAHQVHVSDGG